VLDLKKVCIIVDPTIQNNIHEINVKGDFGEFTFLTRNVASPINPKTSMLAVYSAIATLKKDHGRIPNGNIKIAEYSKIML
jgi:predicted dinucleotide-utilizing enzyme